MPCSRLNPTPADSSTQRPHSYRRARSNFFKRAAVAIVAIVLALLTVPAVGEAAQKGLSVDLTWGDSLREQTSTESILAESGAKYVRMTLNWSDAEPKRGEFSPWWIAQYENAVNLAQQAGGKVIFVVGSSPSWASGSSNTETPPLNPADYAEFIHTMAARFAGRVAAWEIWNEENIPRFWSTGPSAAAYTQLLKAAYPAVKSADANALVLFGGTSLNDYKFISEAYADGAKGSFDAMALHPYSCRAPGTIVREGNGNITADSFLGYRTVHKVMLANGDEKPIWFTEFGWSSSTGGGSCEVGATNQANYLAEAYKLTDQDPYVQVACWYNLRNDYWSHDENSVEAQYGLLSTNFAPKPAFAAFKAYTPGSGAGSEPAKAEEPIGTASSGSKSSRHHRRSTTTLVSTTIAKHGARAARASAAARGRRRAHVVKGEVLGARKGRVVLRFQRFVRPTHSWRVVSVLSQSVSHGRFSVRIAGHAVPQIMRVRVTFDGTPAAAPSSSPFVRFTA